MSAPRRPFIDPGILLDTRVGESSTRRSLGAVHLFVGFIFYSFIGVAVAMFAARLFLDRGPGSTFMLSVAIFCTGAAAVAFIAMLVLGLLRGLDAPKAPADGPAKSS